MLCHAGAAKRQIVRVVVPAAIEDIEIAAYIHVAATAQVGLAPNCLRCS